MNCQLDQPLYYHILLINEGESASNFCCQVVDLVPDMFCNFYSVKNHKIANNSATTEARENNKSIFGILRILEKF
jgi:hypothetical protein